MRKKILKRYFEFCCISFTYGNPLRYVWTDTLLVDVNLTFVNGFIKCFEFFSFWNHG